MFRARPAQLLQRGNTTRATLCQPSTQLSRLRYATLSEQNHDISDESNSTGNIQRAVGGEPTLHKTLPSDKSILRLPGIDTIQNILSSQPVLQRTPHWLAQSQDWKSTQWATITSALYNKSLTFDTKKLIIKLAVISTFGDQKTRPLPDRFLKAITHIVPQSFTCLSHRGELMRIYNAVFESQLRTPISKRRLCSLVCSGMLLSAVLLSIRSLRKYFLFGMKIAREGHTLDPQLQFAIEKGFEVLFLRKRAYLGVDEHEQMRLDLEAFFPIVLQNFASEERKTGHYYGFRGLKPPAIRYILSGATAACNPRDPQLILSSWERFSRFSDSYALSQASTVRGLRDPRDRKSSTVSVTALELVEQKTAILEAHVHALIDSECPESAWRILFAANLPYSTISEDTWIALLEHPEYITEWHSSMTEPVLREYERRLIKIERCYNIEWTGGENGRHISNLDHWDFNDDS